jgi:hypothetical protein
MILSLIAGLLGTFLDWLFTQWLNRFAEAPSADMLVAMKPQFMNRVAWRFWLPGRMDIADKLYDKMAQRYSAPHFTGFRDELYGKKQGKALVQSLMAGLDKE